MIQVQYFIASIIYQCFTVKFMVVNKTNQGHNEQKHTLIHTYRWLAEWALLWEGVKGLLLVLLTSDDDESRWGNYNWIYLHIHMLLAIIQRYHFTNHMIYMGKTQPNPSY